MEKGYNLIEKQLLNIWKSSFAVKNIDINDNFFELGGDSIRAIMVIAKIKKEFDIDIPISFLFLNPSPKKQIEFIYNLKTN